MVLAVTAAHWKQAEANLRQHNSMKATIATFLLALGLVCAASIMLRGTLGVFFSTVVISLLWAFAGAGLLGRKRFNNPMVSFSFAVALTVLVLIGMFSVPLRVAFRLYRAEFSARIMDGLWDPPPRTNGFTPTPPRPLGSTGPFRVISSGSRRGTTYFQLEGSGNEFHGFVYQRTEGDYNVGTSIPLGDGWFYIEED